jgi:hypothetical protein
VVVGLSYPRVPNKPPGLLPDGDLALNRPQRHESWMRHELQSALPQRRVLTAMVPDLVQDRACHQIPDLDCPVRARSRLTVSRGGITPGDEPWIAGPTPGCDNTTTVRRIRTWRQPAFFTHANACADVRA